MTKNECLDKIRKMILEDEIYKLYKCGTKLSKYDMKECENLEAVDALLNLYWKEKMKVLRLHQEIDEMKKKEENLIDGINKVANVFNDVAKEFNGD